MFCIFLCSIICQFTIFCFACTIWYITNFISSYNSVDIISDDCVFFYTFILYSLIDIWKPIGFYNIICFSCIITFLVTDFDTFINSNFCCITFSFFIFRRLIMWFNFFFIWFIFWSGPGSNRKIARFWIFFTIYVPINYARFWFILFCTIYKKNISLKCLLVSKYP